MNQVHKCAKFQLSRRHGSWRQIGLVRERDIEVFSSCRDCGRERPSRFRKVVAIEREASTPQEIVPDASLRRIAQRIVTLSQNHGAIRAEGLIRRLGGAKAEAEIERLATAALLRLIYRRSSGAWRLQSVRLLDRATLEEIARPGLLARRTAALAEARNSVRDLANPEATSIRELLSSNKAVTLDDKVIKALAAIARLLETGDVLPARAFSSQVLGNSKSLSAIRRRLEQLVGPLERLGIRDWGGLVLLAGGGMLHLQNVDVQLNSFHCLGVASEDILRLRSLELPTGGVLVIENLTPFYSCLEHLNGNDSILLLWSGGFPNRGVQRLLEQAAYQKARIRVWCDLDLGGIRIARLIHGITSGTAEPVLMSSETVQQATVSSPLSAGRTASIRRDLEQHPDTMLADTLRSLLDRGEWVEQEALLTNASQMLNDALGP